MKNLFILVSFFISCILTAQMPDIILYNGKIFTSDSLRPYVSALAISGNKILITGDDETVLKIKGSQTRLINLDGRTVIPGINDAHDHPGVEYPARRFITQQSPDGQTPWHVIRDSIRRIVKILPKGTMIRSTINPDLFHDPRARRRTLDSIAPHHPILLSAWTGHGIICNSQTLKLLGYDEGTTVAGGWLEKDADNRLNGILHEYAAYPADVIIGKTLSPKAIEQSLRNYYLPASRWGITSTQAMATELSPKAFKRAYSEDYGLRTRVIAFPFTGKKINLDEWISFFGKLSAKNIVSGVKLIIDGTPIERLAFMSSPYADSTNYRGHLNFSDTEILEFIRFADNNNQQIMVHAVGDSAVKTFLRLLLSVHPAEYWKPKRVRIEHGDLAVMTKDDLDLFREIGIVIVQNPSHFGLPGIMHTRLSNRTSYLQAMKSLLSAGIPLAIGSDGPMNPYLNIMLAAIHPVNPQEALTIEQAVTAYTLGSAFAEFEEKRKGKLAPGYLADLAVLSADIFTLPLPQLPLIHSMLTIVDGKIILNDIITLK